ncbi:MAG: class I SAM-dependent methyltransferase [Pseudomonadota bacterium]
MTSTPHLYSLVRKRRGEHLKAALRKIPGLTWTVRLLRLLVSPRYRSIMRLQHEKPEGLFQPYGTTSSDRYPHIFAFVQDQLAGVTAPRLLSFGCSTGEEVFTLRQYFPRAEITGIDINAHSIAICRKKLARRRDAEIRFQQAHTPEAEPATHYDAVFCMAVLRHGELETTHTRNAIA